MKPKKNQSGLGLIRKLGRGSIALGVAAFQQIPFGVGTVVSVGLHGLAMPSVIRWVQATDVPNRPVSVPVVELEGAELDQLPPSMRQELSTSRAGTSSGEEWDWFGARSGNRGNATVPGESVPKSSAPKTSTPRSGGRSQSSASRSSSSVGGWRSPLDNYFRGNTSDNAQNRRLSRLLAQQQAEIERLRDEQRRRSRDQDLEGDEQDSKGDEKPDGDDTPKGDESQTTDGQGGKGNDGDSKPEAGKGTDIPPDLPEGLRDRITELRNSDWVHDGLSKSDRRGINHYTTKLGEILYGGDSSHWLQKVNENLLKDEDGNKPTDIDDRRSPTYQPEEPLVVPTVPRIFLCDALVRRPPDSVRVAILGGPEGKMVPNEVPRIVTSSGYERLDAYALEWMYSELRDTQLTPYRGFAIHIITLDFPSCDSE